MNKDMLMSLMNKSDEELKAMSRANALEQIVTTNKTVMTIENIIVHAGYLRSIGFIIEGDAILEVLSNMLDQMSNDHV